MVLKETSIFVGLLKNLWRKYRSVELRLDEIYIYSYTCGLIQGLQNKIRVYFRYSFFGKITEIKEEENNMVLNGSRVVTCLINSYKKWRDRTLFYLKTSSTISSIEDLKEELRYFFLRSISIVIFVLIPTNIIISTIFKKEIGLLGWVIRTLLLFIGLGGLFCNVTWEDIKKTSYFLKRINNSRKF